jgi:hypothetical protein
VVRSGQRHAAADRKHAIALDALAGRSVADHPPPALRKALERELCVQRLERRQDLNKVLSRSHQHIWHNLDVEQLNKVNGVSRTVTVIAHDRY